MWTWQPVILNEDWRGTLVVKKQKEERILYRIRDRTSDQGNIPSNGFKWEMCTSLQPRVCTPAKTKFLHASTLLPSRPQINTCATGSTIHRWYNPRVNPRAFAFKRRCCAWTPQRRSWPVQVVAQHSPRYVTGAASTASMTLRILRF